MHRALHRLGIDGRKLRAPACLARDQGARVESKLSNLMRRRCACPRSCAGDPGLSAVELPASADLSLASPQCLVPPQRDFELGYRAFKSRMWGVRRRESSRRFSRCLVYLRLTDSAPMKSTDPAES